MNTFFFGFSSAGLLSLVADTGFFSDLVDTVANRSPSSSDDDPPPNKSTAGLEAGLLSAVKVQHSL